MSSYTVAYVSPYRSHGLYGIEGALDAINIRARLVSEGRWDELSRSERDYVAAIQSGLDEVARIRERTAVTLGERAVELSHEARVYDSGIAVLNDGAQGVDAAERVEQSMKSSAASKPKAAGSPIDLSSAFAAITLAPESEGPTFVDLGQKLLERLARLIALGVGEEEKRCDMLAKVRAAVEAGDENAFAEIEPQARALCLSMEDGGSRRLEDFARYLALCEVVGEAPRELAYGVMLSEIDRLQHELVRRRIEERVAHDIEDAIAEVGLESKGSITLNGAEGLLAVDSKAQGMGLFVHRGDDGALLFSTLSAVDPSSLGNEGRARVREGVRHLCQAKDRLLREAFAKRGLTIESYYDGPVDLSEVRFVPAIARIVSLNEINAEESYDVKVHRRVGE